MSRGLMPGGALILMLLVLLAWHAGAPAGTGTAEHHKISHTAH